jgi:hypothetical protein
VYAGLVRSESKECPACGGAGGRSIGRDNPGWDIETYECLQCGGSGSIRATNTTEAAAPALRVGPGIAKTTPAPRVADDTSIGNEKWSSGR